MKKFLFIFLALVILTGGFFWFGNLVETDDENITEIPIESIKGISASEAETLCTLALGKADKETGFLFSFGASGAVKRGKKEYYVIRASWLVNNSHLSYIGDFFVSADGKKIYSGTALFGEYEIGDLIWEK